MIKIKKILNAHTRIIYFACTLILLAVLNLAAFTSLTKAAVGPSAAPPSVNTGEGNNLLLLIGENCHDIPDEDINKPLHMGSSIISCPGMEDIMSDMLGCTGLYYTHDFHPDSKDNGVKETKWYTKEGAYKDCYNRANAQFNKIKTDCKNINRDAGSSSWDTCETLQNQLHTAIGCSDTMYEDHGEYWGPNPADLSACKDQLTRISHVQIVTFNNGKFGKSGHEIGDPSVKADDGSSQDSGEGSPDCSADINSPLSWIICPLVDMSSAATDFFFQSLVKPLLDEVPVTTKRNDPGYKAWQGFRLIANIILVGAMLLLVYGTATRGGGR